MTDNDLNTYIQLGDVIEYRANKHDIPNKGEIISIGVLSADKIIQVTGGTWLFRGIHQVKRVEIKRQYEDRRLPNPNPMWKSLNKVEVIPAYEDVLSDSEDDEVRGTDSNLNRDDMDIDDQDVEGGDIPQLPKNTDRSKRSERERTSDGSTNHSVSTNNRRIKNEEAKLNRRRRTENYIWWAERGKEYNKARDSINFMYYESLCFGIVDKFYEKAMFSAKSKEEFKKRQKAMRKVISRHHKRHAKRLKLNINNPEFTFMGNTYHGERSRSQETFRTRQTIEEILSFEYKMKTLELQTCSVCRENRLEFNCNESEESNAPSLRSTNEAHCGKKELICDNCIKNKHQASGYYLEKNLQPIWYERDKEGGIRLDQFGEPVVRYDIPQELQQLTMAEKLLIRRCSPLIPSHHIKNGIYGIDGHCVAFPQNIGPMCTDLPQKQSDMVIFVRHISNRKNGTSHSQHFKVNKVKVIEALKWLKKHHRGYHDITITESNLDWIEGDSVYDSVNRHEIHSKPSRRDAMVDAPEVVSDNQCKEPEKDEEDEYDLEVVGPNYKDDTPNPEQSETIKEFQKIARDTNQTEKMLDFPFIDHGQPLK